MKGYDKSSAGRRGKSRSLLRFLGFTPPNFSKSRNGKFRVKKENHQKEVREVQGKCTEEIAKMRILPLRKLIMLNQILLDTIITMGYDNLI